MASGKDRLGRAKCRLGVPAEDGHWWAICRDPKCGACEQVPERIETSLGYLQSSKILFCNTCISGAQLRKLQDGEIPPDREAS